MARYGKKAQSKVKRAMHERKRGTLRSGRSGRKVTSRKQAIAIGLSEARRAGGKVPSRSSGTCGPSRSLRDPLDRSERLARPGAMAVLMEQSGKPVQIALAWNPSHPHGAVLIEHHIERAISVGESALIGGKTHCAEGCQEMQTLVIATP